MLLDVTKEWIKTNTLTYRKKLGQFFTPDDIKNELFSFLPKKEDALILEPAVGTGEFVDGILKNFKNCKLDVYDIDNNILKLVTSVSNKSCKSFLELEAKPIYDYVITNPPYGIKFDDCISPKFDDVIGGRVNIYSLFIKQGIDFLKEGGYLAYVVPTSMNNGRYFEQLRNYILKTCEIEHIIHFNDRKFVDAQQNVQVIILRKGKNTGKNTFTKNGVTIFTHNAKKIASYYVGTKSIKELGYSVKTGTIEWSKNKDKLTDDAGATTLIWSHNIKQTGLELDNSKSDKKNQYINIPGQSGPAIVVNRIVGTVGSGMIKAAIVDGKFLAENHVNVITAVDPRVDINVILNSLLDSKTLELLHLLTGNTQLSKTELENLIPIKV